MFTYNYPCFPSTYLPHLSVMHLQWDGVWRWSCGMCSDNESRSLIVGICVLIRRDTSNMTAFFTLWGHSEKVAICKQEGPDQNWISQYLDFGFLASKSVRNICLMFKLPNLLYSVTSVRTETLIFLHPKIPHPTKSFSWLHYFFPWFSIFQVTCMPKQSTDFSSFLFP